MRSKFLPLEKATCGVYHRPKASTDERKNRQTKHPRLDQDRSQSRRSATRDICHLLKVSADRRSSRWEDHRLEPRLTSAEGNHQIAPIKRQKRRKSESALGCSSQKGKDFEKKECEICARILQLTRNGKQCPALESAENHALA